MNELTQDLRYGLRSLRRQPVFTLVAVISLALGIGANTAIFSLVNAVLLTPLQFSDPNRLVMVWEAAPEIGFPQSDASVANFADWKAQNKVFDDMAGISFRSFNITGDGDAEKVQAYAATANFFPLLGITPALGRNFSSDEDQAGGSNVTILSYGLWQRRYGGDPGILGRDILLNGQKHTVVGVMPSSFRFLNGATSVWVPAAFTQKQFADRKSNNVTVVARLKAGVTTEQAQADIGNITKRITQEYPNEVPATLKAAVVPLREQVSGQSRRPLIMLLVAVAFVLLIACANIANLLLARATNRRQEIAVRSAVGANRGRIVRQLLTESVILSSLGGVLGLIVAAGSFEFLKKLIPPGIVASTLRLDLRVLGYALFISVLTGIIFGLVPALQASRVDLSEALKQGGGSSGLGSGGGRLRGSLVVTEVALALVLLVGAGLLVQTLSNLRGQYSILQPENLLTVRTVLQANKYYDAPKRWQFYEDVLDRVKALPGVVSVGYTTSVPLQWKSGANNFTFEGQQQAPGAVTNAIHRQVSSDYFKTIGIALREGRYFNNGDNENSQPSVIVNETLAGDCWPGQSAVGKRIQFENTPWFTIVGVVADVRQMGIDLPVKAEMYFPYRQMKTSGGFRPRDLVIRTAGDPLKLVPAVRREVHAVDSEQPVSSVATMEQLLNDESQTRRVGMILLVAFAALSLLLAVMGIYAVLAFYVTQHRPEIGVRMALGARRRDILGLVLKKGMGLVLTGVAIGLLGAFALTRLMANLLFGVTPTDPTTFAAIALFLAGVAFLACYLPARWATKVDPLVALRHQ
jgi:predicted permease